MTEDVLCGHCLVQEMGKDQPPKHCTTTYRGHGYSNTRTITASLPGKARRICSWALKPRSLSGFPGKEEHCRQKKGMSEGTGGKWWWFDLLGDRVVVGEREEIDTAQHPKFFRQRKRTQSGGQRGRGKRKANQTCEVLKDIVNSDSPGWRWRWAAGPWTAFLSPLPPVLLL